MILKADKQDIIGKYVKNKDTVGWEIKMDRTERVTLTNMCMIYDGEGNVLIQNRNDENWPGIVFPGGHVEKGESIIESVQREIREETGLIITNLQQCGIKQFFSKKDGRYIVFLYKTSSFEGNIISSEEGSVRWVKYSELPSMELADGFVDMLPIFMEEKKELIYRNNIREWIV